MHAPHGRSRVTLGSKRNDDFGACSEPGFIRYDPAEENPGGHARVRAAFSAIGSAFACGAATKVDVVAGTRRPRLGESPPSRPGVYRQLDALGVDGKLDGAVPELTSNDPTPRGARSASWRCVQPRLDPRSRRGRSIRLRGGGFWTRFGLGRGCTARRRVTTRYGPSEEGIIVGFGSVLAHVSDPELTETSPVCKQSNRTEASSVHRFDPDAGVPVGLRADWPTTVWLAAVQQDERGPFALARQSPRRVCESCPTALVATVAAPVPSRATERTHYSGRQFVVFPLTFKLPATVIEP